MMGLYLAIFNGDEDIDGVDVGTYSDFGRFRDTVANAYGDISSFPVLMGHSDCDGEWSTTEAERLITELDAIGEAFRSMPPIGLIADWQIKAAKTFGIQLNTCYDCFFDVDGEPLIERLQELARTSVRTGLPIVFQ